VSAANNQASTGSPPRPRPGFLFHFCHFCYVFLRKSGQKVSPRVCCIPGLSSPCNYCFTIFLCFLSPQMGSCRLFTCVRILDDIVISSSPLLFSSLLSLLLPFFSILLLPPLSFSPYRSRTSICSIKSTMAQVIAPMPPLHHLPSPSQGQSLVRHTTNNLQRKQSKFPSNNSSPKPAESNNPAPKEQDPGEKSTEESISADSDCEELAPRRSAAKLRSKEAVTQSLEIPCLNELGLYAFPTKGDGNFPLH
jgi:hypothetical protein